MRVSTCALLAVFAVTPALADPRDNFSSNIQMSPDVYSVPDETPQDMQPDARNGCMRLLERAFYMPDPASLDRAIDAHHEMEMARDAFNAGDQSACEHHARRALSDRS